jgi:hypothetical protein
VPPARLSFPSAAARAPGARFAGEGAWPGAAVSRWVGGLGRERGRRLGAEGWAEPCRGLRPLLPAGRGAGQHCNCAVCSQSIPSTKASR